MDGEQIAGDAMPPPDQVGQETNASEPDPIDEVDASPQQPCWESVEPHHRLESADANNGLIPASTNAAINDVCMDTALQPCSENENELPATVAAPITSGVQQSDGQTSSELTLKLEGQSPVDGDVKECEHDDIFREALPNGLSEPDLQSCTARNEVTPVKENIDEGSLSVLLDQHISSIADNVAVELTTQSVAEVDGTQREQKITDGALSASPGYCKPGESPAVEFECAAIESATQPYTESKDISFHNVVSAPTASQTIPYGQDDELNDVATQNYEKNEIPEQSVLEQDVEDMCNCAEDVATQNYEKSESRPLPSPCRSLHMPEEESSEHGETRRMPPPPPPAKRTCTRENDSLAVTEDSPVGPVGSIGTPSFHPTCLESERLATQDYADTHLPEASNAVAKQNNFTLQMESSAIGKHEGTLTFADSEEIATQQYVGTGCGTVGTCLPDPMPNLQSADSGSFAAAPEDCATQRYGDDTSMPPPPVLWRAACGQKTDSCCLVDDSATQCYEDKAYTESLVMPPFEDSATQRYEDSRDFESMGMPPPEECATQRYEEEADLARIAMPPGPLPPRSAEGSCLVYDTQPSDDLACDSSKLRLSAMDDEVLATQAYADPAAPRLGLLEVPCAQQDTCLTQCYSGFEFSGSVCIVPDGADSSDEENANRGVSVLDGSRALGAAPKWSAKPQSSGREGVMKRPAAVANINTLMSGSSGSASSSASRHPLRKRPLELGSPTATIAQDLASTPKRRLCGKQKAPVAYATLSKPTPVKEAAGSRSRGCRIEASPGRAADPVSHRAIRKPQDCPPKPPAAQPARQSKSSKAIAAKSLFDGEEDSDDEVMWLGKARPGVFAQS